MHAEPRRDLPDLIDRVAAGAVAGAPGRDIMQCGHSSSPSFSGPGLAGRPPRGTPGRPGPSTGQFQSIGRSGPRGAVAPVGAEKAGFAPKPPNIPPMPVGDVCATVETPPPLAPERCRTLWAPDGTLRTRSTGLLRSVRQIRCGLQVERPAAKGGVRSFAAARTNVLDEIAAGYKKFSIWPEGCAVIVIGNHCPGTSRLGRVLVASHPHPRREEPLPHRADLVLDLPLLQPDAGVHATGSTR